jgi:hypothetical protein
MVLVADDDGVAMKLVFFFSSMKLVLRVGLYIYSIYCNILESSSAAS